MASGSIIEECSICGNIIWEDEEFTFSDKNKFIHVECLGPPEKLYTRQSLNALQFEYRKLKELRELIDHQLDLIFEERKRRKET